jgi:5-(carboxyamino)imidazole ribonucleotide mutase
MSQTRSSQPFVAVLMGSDSDLPVMQSAVEVLDLFGVPREVRITSAHRTPAATQAYVRDAEARGCAVFIAAAGLAAHLAGAVAAHTVKPVIGVPLDAGPLSGMDALLSTVQMPAGVPVACVAIGKTGARNAAWLAVQILALSDPALAARLREEREKNAQAVIERDARLQEELARPRA